MGFRRIRAWANLLVMAGLNLRLEDHYLMALVRAHLCEGLMAHEQPRSGTGFTVGLLSILDLLLGRPMDEILAELPLSDEITLALLHREGHAGNALECARRVEDGEWQRVAFPGLEREEIYRLYLEASEQAFLDQRSLKEL